MDKNTLMLDIILSDIETQRHRDQSSHRPRAWFGPQSHKSSLSPEGSPPSVNVDLGLNPWDVQLKVETFMDKIRTTLSRFVIKKIIMTEMFI